MRPTYHQAGRSQTKPILMLIGAVILGVILLVAGPAVLLNSIPFITKAQWDLYVDVVRHLTARDDPDQRQFTDLGLLLKARWVVAVDVVQRRQNMQDVTRQTIYDLAQEFVAFQRFERSIAGVLRSTGDERMHTFRRPVPENDRTYVTSYIASVTGPVSADLRCGGDRCNVFVTATADHAQYEVGVVTVKYTLRDLELVMTRLHFTEDEKRMARSIAQFDPSMIK